MNRADMLIARDRISKLVGQVEAMSWGDRSISAKWLFEALKPVAGDINSLTWFSLTAESKRDPKGRFKAKK